MKQNYLNWKNCDGIRYHERSDAFMGIPDKCNIEERYYWAISRLKKHKIKSVLDVGCGLGYGTNLLFGMGFEVEGVDKSYCAIDVCKKRYPYINFTQSEFPGQALRKYDAIVANEIIEHVTNPEKFIKDCLNLISSGGILLISTPNKRYIEGKNPHHLQEFTVDELKKLMPNFKIRGLTSHLFKGQRIFLKLLSYERMQKLKFLFSRLPIIHGLPQYSHTLVIELEKHEF